MIARPLERISPASSLVLKIYAIAAMVVDHVDWMMFDGSLGFHYTWGRTVFPIFALLMGYNAMRAEPSHLVRSVAPRLLAIGLVAQIPYGYLVVWQGPWNVLFTLALALLVNGWWRAGRRILPVLAFVLGGALVDYQWWGLVVVLGCGWALEQRRFPWWAFAIVWTIVLLPINGNAWALAAGPIVAIAVVLEQPAPRWKWLFYAFYPAHLVLLAIVIGV